MKWWTDLWLNEGFATYVSTLGVGYVHPEWNVIMEDAADNMVEVFRLDALNTSHPVSLKYIEFQIKFSLKNICINTDIYPDRTSERNRANLRRDFIQKRFNHNQDDEHIFRRRSFPKRSQQVSQHKL